MLFVNNLAVLHQRDAFIDDAETGQTRFLLSLMLKDPRRAWKQPQEIALFTDGRFAAPDARALPSLREWRALRLGRLEGGEDLPSFVGHSPAQWLQRPQKHD